VAVQGEEGGMSYRKEVLADGVELYCGDCLEVLPTLGKFDAVVTDPPYSSGGFTQSAISKAKGQGLRSETIAQVGWFSGDAMTAAGGAFLLRELARLAFSTTFDTATLTVFTDWRVSALYSPAIESARWRYQNMLVWDKGNAGLGSGFRAQHELALHFSKGAPPYFSASYGNVLKSSRVGSGDKEHQTEKPVDLMRQILEVVSDVGGTALDPFMGSGTTGVAAVKLGRKFTGIEIDLGYFDIACRRIDAALREPDMFVDAPKPKAEQLALLDSSL
jgi:site-specific DNA-methyltransferase (adenine-specific)